MFQPRSIWDLFDENLDLTAGVLIIYIYICVSVPALCASDPRRPLHVNQALPYGARSANQRRWSSSSSEHRSPHICCLRKNSSREVNEARRPDTCSRPCAFEEKKTKKKHDIPPHPKHTTKSTAARRPRPPRHGVR